MKKKKKKQKKKDKELKVSPDWPEQKTFEDFIRLVCQTYKWDYFTALEKIKNRLQRYNLKPRHIEVYLNLFGWPHLKINSNPPKIDPAKIDWSKRPLELPQEKKPNLVDYLAATKQTIHNDLNDIKELWPDLVRSGISACWRNLIRIGNSHTLRNVPDSDETKSFVKRAGIRQKLTGGYNWMPTKLCPQCSQNGKTNYVKMSATKCNCCGHEWPCLCERCGRSTGGPLYCHECIQPGFNRHKPNPDRNARRAKEEPQFCGPYGNIKETLADIRLLQITESRDRLRKEWHSGKSSPWPLLKSELKCEELSESEEEYRDLKESKQAYLSYAEQEHWNELPRYGDPEVFNTIELEE